MGEVAYSFLAMTAYNILKPITRSQFISVLGADNLPYVQLAAGLLIGVVMQGYNKAASLLLRLLAATVLRSSSSVLPFSADDTREFTSSLSILRVAGERRRA